MKFKALLFASIVAGTLSASATVTIQFNESFVGGIPSNLANSAGVISNGMRWGIVVSTTDGTFAGGGTNYDPYAAGPATAGFLNQGGAASDDYYIPGTLTADGSILVEGDFSTAAGNGSIVDDLVVSLTNGVSLNDKFALIWFSDNTSSNGSKYGFFTDPTFVMPADGSTTGYGSPFVGNDPTRTASFTFGGPTVVPEPSRLMLLGLGVFGLFFRRRR
jgi:hypothetical protein